MIQFDKDGVTLFYTDANGNRVAHNFMDGLYYNAMLDIRTAQILAERENAQAASTYEVQVKDAEAAFHFEPAIPKPLKKVVSDNGMVAFAPFDPPLRDMIVPRVNTGSGNLKTEAPDANKRQDVMYNMILAMFRKFFPEA